MKIAEVVSTFPPYYGGMGNACLQFSVELACLGHTVEVYTVEVPGRETVDPGSIVVHRLPAQLQIGNAPLLLGLFRLSDVDVIHLHYPFFFGAEIIRVLSVFRRIPYVVTYHMDARGTGWRGRVFRLHKELLLSPLMTGARQIYVSSLDYVRQSDLVGVRSVWDRLYEVPLGVDTALFRPTAPSVRIRSELGLGSRDRVVMFVGQLDRPHYFKGLPVLLRAMSGIHDPLVKLVVVGDGDMRASFSRTARSLGVADRVIFAGEVNHQLLNDYLSVCEFTAQPSHTEESFGMVLLEAHAAGRAVIASNLPGSRTVVADGTDGLLCEPNDPRDLRAKIQYLLDNPDVSLAFGKRGRLKVAASYSWEAVTLRLNDHLTHVVAGDRT